MQEKFDYIVVGSGAGGSPLASRLSENPDITVAVIEAGGENTNDLSRIPSAFAHVWGTEYDWKYNTTEQKGLNSRKINHPRGHVIGGSTAINGGFWLRGSQGDYDSWEKMGAKGWNFKEALRFFREKIEDTDRGPNEYRGKGGMMYMSDLPTPTILSDKLEEGFEEAKLGVRGDNNGAQPCSTARLQTIFKNHSRLTAGDNYLSEEIRKRKNLKVIINTLVHKVIFEGKRAVGVEVESDGKVFQIKADKEVILCAGAFNTPKILKLSGVGPKAELERLDIPVVANVPGVGENLSDHLMSTMNITAPEGVNVSVPMDSSDAAIAQWRKDKTGPAIYWSTNTIGFFALHDTFDADIELMMDYNGSFNVDDPSLKADEARSGYTLTTILLQPKSRGRVTLKSSNPADAPVIDPQYLTDSEDIKKFIAGFRKAAEMTKSNALHPYTEKVNPLLSAKDEEIEAHIRSTASTVFHPAGTAKMGDLNDPMTVVDENLCVRGLSGLRVADASVMPMVNRGHTMTPTIFIGERLAELIKKGK